MTDIRLNMAKAEAEAAVRPRRRPGGVRSRERAAWGFVAPALIAIAVFFAIPVFAALLLSLTDFDIYALADLNNVRFIGLQNYERLFANPLFWGAMRNTGLFAVLGVPLSIAVSLAAAVILNARVVKWRP
ncbi:carbohydrate ABC transporter permease, partial [Brevundimonas sp.]|uniref:carbohydrate ABC transporter permease n=1 Tax=Brevundimonas sp. TaxID=1871086 RepID=UPI0027EBFA06|nr:hypothetical protein [Brevundimonas sp.]